MKIIKNPWVWISLGVIIIGFLITGLHLFVERPQSLGSELEFIGESKSGCYFICDSAPSSTYFFATNLKEDELKSYFTKAKYIPQDITEGGSSGNYTFRDLYFENNQERFVLVYYSNIKSVIESFGLKNTDKQFVVSISDQFYKKAKDSL